MAEGEKRRIIDGELLISADSHVVEPRDLWTTCLPGTLREQVPLLPERRGDQPGATDPADRLGVMLRDDVSMEVLYPTYGLTQFAIEDAALQEACFRVYNDWLVEYCAGTPGRLVGIASIPAYDIDHAVAELERARAAGLVGCHLWHVPPSQLSYRSDHYERLFSACEAFEAPLHLHILSGFSYTRTARPSGLEHYRGSVEQKLMDAVSILFDLIFYGALERHPRLELVLAEFEIGWIPWLLQQWDYYVRRFATNNPTGLSLLPSEYFARQVHATFFYDHVGTSLFQLGWGTDNCMWSNDFPHGNTTWPNSRDVVERDLGMLDPDLRAKLLRDNVARLYGLEIPSPIGTQAG